MPQEVRTPGFEDGQLLAKLMVFFFFLFKKKCFLKTSMACQRKDNLHSQKFIINFLVKVRIKSCFEKKKFLKKKM